jgi:hypothetical protein
LHFLIEGEGLIPFLLQKSLSKEFGAKLPDLMNRFKSQFEMSFMDSPR